MHKKSRLGPAMFTFFSTRFLNMCMSRKKFYLLWWACLPGLAFHGSGLTCLPSWLRMMNVGWLCSMRWEIFLQMKLSFFKTVPSNSLHFYLDSLLHRISFLSSYFCLIRNGILQKILKLRFWKFNLIFLIMQFSLVATFFPLVLVICLSWYLHLKLSHEFLTLISFKIWR